MEYSKELKEEILNTELIMNTRIELEKLLKSYLEKKKKDGKPYCVRCISQDFEIGEYDPENTKQYYDLTLNEEKTRTATRQTKNGLKICQPHNHYDCPRGHGVIIPDDYWTEAPTIKAPEQREQREKEQKEKVKVKDVEVKVDKKIEKRSEL